MHLIWGPSLGKRGDSTLKPGNEKLIVQDDNDESFGQHEGKHVLYRKEDIFSSGRKFWFSNFWE